MNVSAGQLQSLCDIARTAGQAVMTTYRQETTLRHDKEDGSPVTAADLAADRIITAGLRAAFPGIFVLSEESVSGARQDAESFFLVDPLDGTREFLARNGEFTVNIALVHRHEVVAGVVFAPATDELFFAATDIGAWKQGARNTRLQVSQDTNGRPLRVIGSRSHADSTLDGWLAASGREYRFVATGSSLKFCRIAEGKADLYPRFGITSQWDTAAAQCVLEEAGGAVVTLASERLGYGLDRPLHNPPFVAFGDAALRVLVR